MYVVICAPRIHKPEGERSDEAAQNSIALAAGMVVALVGRASFLTYLGDYIVDADTMQQSYYAPIVRSPQLEDGASLSDGAIVSEILPAMGALPEEKRNEIAYCWSIFGRAVKERDETFRFTLYWIALEVAADTKGDGLAAKLGNAYGKSKKFAYDELGFRPIYNMRHDVVHKGARVSLRADMERIMQCCFLELLRARLGLPCKKIVAGLVDHLDEMRSRSLKAGRG